MRLPDSPASLMPMRRTASTVDGQGDDQAAAKVAEQEEQHGDHEQPALDQVLLDGVDGARHEVGTVVEDIALHTLGQDGPQATAAPRSARSAPFAETAAPSCRR